MIVTVEENNNPERILTTTDNPWDPFRNWDEWYEWDISHGYNTCSLLARLGNMTCNTVNILSSKEYDDAIENAMTKVIYYSEPGLYKIVEKEND